MALKEAKRFSGNPLDGSSAAQVAGGWGRRNSTGVAIASSLRFENVSFSSNKLPILDDITLEVEPGNVLCLLGPSGSGKTTLLRVAAGLIKPDKGSVYIDGKAVAGNCRFVPPEQRGVGLVFQDFALFPHLTIRKNVEFGLTALTRKQARTQAEQLLERVGMQSRADEYPHVLSGGELQRVALARALAPRPGILLMDEPFSGLDSRMRDAIRQQSIELLRETRSTAVIVTHDPEEALRIGDRIALIREGRLVQEGTGEELYKTPNCLFAAEFFSELNVLPAKISGKSFTSPLGSFPLAANHEYTGNAVKLAIRMGDFRVRSWNERSKGSAGHVIARRFVGTSEILEIRLDGHEALIRAKVDAGAIPEDAQVVEVTADKRRVMIFQ